MCCCSDNSLENVIRKLSADSALLIIYIFIRWFLNKKMKANLEQFQAIAVGEKTKIEDITFNLDNNVIKCVENVKLLGVTIDFQQNFNVQVSINAKRASKQSNVLKRIGKHFCRLGKLNSYHSFILSNFNYCPLTFVLGSSVVK